VRERPIQNEQQLIKASQDLLKLKDHLPLLLTVTQGNKLRTKGQNDRYWANMDDFLYEINEAVEMYAERVGETNIQARREIAIRIEEKFDCPVEYMAILFVRTKEAAHEIMKMICNIPTSTRLGTKEFQKLGGILEMTMAEILGLINSVK
jgi:hypothetical protein